METLIPNSFQMTKTPFSDMVLTPNQALRAAKLFERVLRESFEFDETTMGKEFRRRIQTGAEMKRRVDIAAQWFRVFRGDLGYSLARIEAELGKALRCELDGEKIYTPRTSRGTYGVPEGDKQ